MDSIFAIALGLGIRLLVDVVSQHDFRVGGSLVGLWEGVVLYHFLAKMPKSYDPYVAYGFRLFVDFLFTESLYRMALVILWTALGMVLSDIAPVFWYDLGLRRLYRRFRRDVESFGLPTLPFFSKTSTSSRVRFRSPSRASSVVTSVRSMATSTSSSTITPTNVTPNSTPVISPAVIHHTRRKTRIVPGSFPGDWSETDADSVLEPYIPPSETSDDESQPPNHDLHPILETDESSVGSDRDQDHHGLTETPDDYNLLSEASSESADPSAKDPLEIPEEDEAPLSDQKQDQDRTPTAHHIPLPPTPAESAVGTHEPHEVQPPLSEVPLIPDSPFVRDTFDTENREEGSPPPKPIPPVVNDNLSPPASDDPPSTTDDTPRDADPPAYIEFPKANPTSEPDETLANDTTTENKPLPSINVEPPLPHNPTDTDLPKNDLHDESSPPLAPPSQTDKQPKLGDDLSHNGDSRSIADTERPESMLPENTSTRLEQALTFRREAAEIQKRILDVEGERKKALEGHKSAIALLKSQEREGLEREEKELNRKAERRFFTVNNASSTPGEISVIGLEPGEAVSRIEAALAGLLGQPQASHGDSVELRVALGQSKKKMAGIMRVKVRIRTAMKEHQIPINDGPNASTLIITLPKL